MKLALFICFTIGFLAAQDHVAPSVEFKMYKQEIDRWHERRLKGLQRDHGWLSLIALDWLKEGENPINDIGSILVNKGSITVRLKNGVNGLLNGKPFVSGPVAAETDRVIIGTKAVAVIERGGKFAVRIWDAETPARKNFTGVDRFPVVMEWKIEARWTPYSVPKKVEIPTVIPGLTQEGIAPGVAHFMLNGKEYSLEPTVEDGETEYFFVFGDKTNGKETYGAGRFLYTLPPKEGKIVLDFNKSYNPPCVFTDYATCPVPTPENRLPVRIEAGEKKYKHHP
ncbi:MAG: DUF1684 domain-containing protein [Bacteroidota bacterium]